MICTRRRRRRSSATFPDVPVILAHMGGLSMDQTGEDRLYRMPENVYIDTAMSAEFQDKDEFERIAGSFGPDRVIFGSDFPMGARERRSAL